jgi:hypothetical protein
MNKYQLREAYKKETNLTAVIYYDGKKLGPSAQLEHFEVSYVEWLESKLTTHNGGLTKSRPLCHNCSQPCKEDAFVTSCPDYTEA